ncbi:MAG: PH domain-containing protein [Anaerolinea sp.]|nr:PH domain-containing protein [Anaerolinea sp.]
MQKVVGPEKQIAVFRRSPWTFGFWWRTILTLTLYYFTLWRLNQISLTTRRIMQRRGNIITGNETTIDLENVTDITVNKSLLGQIFNYGDISIQSAGSNASEISFTALQRPDKLREIIFDLKDGRLDEEKL